MRKQETAAKILQLIEKQPSSVRHMYCYQCGFQFSKRLPVTMPLEKITCDGCLYEGYCLYRPKDRK